MCSSITNFLTALDASAPTVFDVEKIIADDVINGTRQFLVTQKNWDSEFKIWIPIEKFSSLKLVNEYCVRNNIRNVPFSSSNQRAEKLFQSLASVPKDFLNRLCEQFALTSKDELELPQSNREELLREIEQVVDDEKLQTDENMMRLRRQVLIETIIEKRAEQLQKLQEQEWAINSCSDNAEAIRVTNNRDLEVLPEHFKYVNNYVIISPNINLQEISESTRHRFSCSGPHRNNLCTKRCTCKKLFSGGSSYKDGKIIISKVRKIQECNKFCSCGPLCGNRVVQHGCKLKIEIFRSATGTGWAVRTLEEVPAGTFVGRYVGHVIRSTDGELLSHSQADGNYLYDLSSEKSNGIDQHQRYTVNAYKYGNFTRFFNHSCSPNLDSIRVWINNLNPHIPEIAFFANRSIHEGEELTINYNRESITF